ncbi:hypothetical protein C7B65_06960 [Phormidesmis priestleyi ULC007]|uniref:Uncharacterized protein n=1 Tax=Phormidesmis priestleyi ULC007 TaxID=1920490 RepID=A0A2T1DJF6_9CYAN|nr:hypothetical protein [Phormidesmis priestleyi]PSB20638.1 hypothetical protein C7B65_06960 [Phormidesmis priestleyi ULC007]PZO54308.1 MAG: hypothetical protein DCF14_02605 [Phormidesmis priestleyi]
MQAAFKVTTKVLPGNKIEIQLPSGSEGDEVDVFVVLPQKASVSQSNVLDMIEQARKRYAFRTAEDIDQQIRSEREAWDS